MQGQTGIPGGEGIGATGIGQTGIGTSGTVPHTGIPNAAITLENGVDILITEGGFVLVTE